MSDPAANGCSLPVFTIEMADQMSSLMVAYEGANAPEHFYGYVDDLDPLGQPTSSADFQNVYEAKNLGVMVTVGETRILTPWTSSYETFAANERDLDDQPAPIDAPGYTWAGSSTTDTGYIDLEYFLIAGDRFLNVTFVPRTDIAGVETPPDPAAATSVAEGVRTILCG